MLSQTAHYLFKRRLINAIALPVLLMFVLAGVSIGQIHRLLVAMQWVEHTDQVIAQANRLQRLMTEVESGLRGYLLTDEQEFLAPHQQAKILVEPSFDALTHLVADNRSQVQRLTQIRSQYREWEESVPVLLNTQQTNEPTNISLLQRRGRLMVQIRNQMTEFIQVEERLRDARSQTVQKTTRTVVRSSIILAFCLGGLLAYFIWRQIQEISKTYEQALQTAHKQTQTAQRSAHRLATLHKIDQAILAAQSIDSLAEAILAGLNPLIAYEQGAVILFNFGTNQGLILAGHIAGRQAGTSMAIADYLPQAQLQPPHLGSWYVKEIAELEPCPPTLTALLAEGYHSFLATAILINQEVIGNLALFATVQDAFSREDQEIVREVVDQLAIAIQQSQLRDQLQEYANQLEQRVADRTLRLQEGNEELEAFSYTIAHDLRAPLRGIEGFAQALLEDYSSQLDTMAQDYIQRIFASINRMNTLIQDLLAYSRLSRVEIQLTPLYLEKIVTEALTQLETELRDRQAQITVAEHWPIVIGHRSTLIQVVSNLLSNAIKFVAPGAQPRIRIWAEEKEQWVRLWIEDNGIGVEGKYQEKIFGVFERLHGREAYPGTGIGLAIVRKGIERMGGHSGVESAVNQGSRFWVELQGISSEQS